MDRLSLPFSELVRPAKVADLMLPDAVLKAFARMIVSKEPMNMLFYGRPGSGKTSAARVIAAEAGLASTTINGSDQNDLKMLVTRIQTFASSLSLEGHGKLCLIEEADALSKRAQTTLRGVIEDAATNCRFILTANDITRVDPAVRSRCKCICFDASITQAQTFRDKVLTRLVSICAEHRPEIDPEDIEASLKAHFPDLRAVANDLEFILNSQIRSNG